MREWHRRNPRSVKNTNLRRYGVTIEDYERMLVEQGDACAICREPFDHDEYRGIHVDHCHTNGTVRGLLCRGCNTMLANAKDCVPTLERAVEYLRRIA